MPRSAAAPATSTPASSEKPEDDARRDAVRRGRSSLRLTRQRPTAAAPESGALGTTRDPTAISGHSKSATRSPSASTDPRGNEKGRPVVSGRQLSSRQWSRTVNRSRVSEPVSSLSVLTGAPGSYGSKRVRKRTAEGSMRRRSSSTSTRADTASPNRCCRGSTRAFAATPRSLSRGIGSTASPPSSRTAAAAATPVARTTARTNARLTRGATPARAGAAHSTLRSTRERRRRPTRRARPGRDRALRTSSGAR